MNRCARHFTDVGELGEVKDSFGHVMFSSSQTTVAQTVVNYLNKVGLSAKGTARGNVSGDEPQRTRGADLERGGELAPGP